MVKKSKSKVAASQRSDGSKKKAAPRVQSAFSLTGDELERMLVTGEGRGLAEDYFGAREYAELRDMARDAATRSVRGGPPVLILPGIMGSTIGKRNQSIDNVLWFDPVEIALGRLAELKLGASPTYQAVGVILLAYLKLKLRLRIAGFDARFHPFDWRYGLDTLGAQLAQAINKDPAKQVSLVAHSMGGLVARAALPHTRDKVRRLIMLGTPNYGSFAPVQVLRGTYDVVLKVAAIDLRHTAEQLCSQVFTSFPGIYQMLPAPERFGGVDLYDPAAWPKNGPQPQAPLLSGVKSVIRKLAPADSRFFLVAGVNRDTVTGMNALDGEFTYEVSPNGDGTVPLAFARLDGIPERQTYYIEEGHGSLPNNRTVGRAVQDLLASGVTAALPQEAPPLKRAARTLSEEELRIAASRSVPPGQLGTADFRHVLDSVAAPDSRDMAGVEAPAADMEPPQTPAGAPAPVLTREFKNLVVGRRRQQRLELTLARGSITEVETRAYVLGIFRNVAPAGAANAIDRALDGAISEFTLRRMFSGDVGEVFTMPMGRNGVRADMIMLAGLGPFDRFNGEVQQLVAENVIRTLVRGRVDDFATVLMGNSSGQSVAFALQNLLVGFIRGLRDADQKRRFRGLTLCETDPSRYAQMKDELFRLTSTPLFDETEVILEEIELPAPPERSGSRAFQAAPDPIYLMVRQEGGTERQQHFRSSVLGAGMKAAVVTSVREVDKRKLNEILAAFDHDVANGAADTERAGARFAELMLPEDMRAALQTMRDRHLVLVHDAPAARIPWETLSVDGWRPAIEAGLSRRYLSDNLSIATWLEQRRADPILSLLLITNPTQDLPGAEGEGDRIQTLARSVFGVKVTEYRGSQATKPAILSALRSGAFDIVHYAGHAFFDPQSPGRSGLICAGRQVLSGADLSGISNLPFAVFFNACEAGRVRGKSSSSNTAASKRVHESFGVAEALMRGGISNYLSTYWPVSDMPAAKFAETFYSDVLSGKTIGDALLAARQAVRAAGSRDWADYVLYGSSALVLKSAAERAG